MSETLEPCPFCKGEPEINVNKHADPHEYWVRCKTCGAVKDSSDGVSAFTNENAAIKSWNTRATIEQ